MRYILEEVEVTDKNTIRNVAVRYQEGGIKAEIVWDWPRDLECTNCFIYSIPEEIYNESDLSKIVRENAPEIRDRRAPEKFTIEITRTGMRCILVPGMYDRINGCYTLVPQKEGNVTPLMKIHPEIHIKLMYEEISRGLFRKSLEKKAVFTCTGKEQPMPGSKLVYRCVGGGRNNIRYGIDLSEFWGKTVTIVIGNDEILEFEEPEDGSFRIR